MRHINKPFVIVTVVVASSLFLIGLSALLHGVLGGGLPIVASVLFVLMILISYPVKRTWSKLYQVMSRFVIGCSCFALLILIVASLQILSKYHNQKAPDDSVMIVLGCGLSRVDHTAPSLTLYKRIMVAEKYLQEHPKTVCVLSGGQGGDENISEAQAMYTFLTTHGISSSRLYKEEKSTSTNENMMFSKQMMMKEGLITDERQNNVIIVTDGFHEFRAQHLASQYNLKSYTLSSKTPLGVIGLYWLREVACVVLQIWI